VGATAYKLQLPDERQIHNVFHVSQLKPFTPNYSPVFSELPVLVDLSIGIFLPQQILERRMVKKGNSVMPQIKVLWSTLPPECATWEENYVLRCRFPDAAIWKEASSQGGEGVASPYAVNMVTDTGVDTG
jgi:hypothetical protein